MHSSTQRERRPGSWLYVRGSEAVHLYTSGEGFILERFGPRQQSERRSFDSERDLLEYAAMVEHRLLSDGFNGAQERREGRDRRATARAGGRERRRTPMVGVGPPPDTPPTTDAVEP